jgi:hypothetical protein
MRFVFQIIYKIVDWFLNVPILVKQNPTAALYKIEIELRIIGVIAVRISRIKIQPVYNL